ncbi:sensor histidine kinase [Massilia sp. S19_KUP03_FR1]|uniref:sensor histidine kinase n=1 Tax=Massilia sp. S19_KUP03_FR1 TaxID=3025503 RepID=UPI002FCDD197
MFSTIRRGLFAAIGGFTVCICVCYTGLALVVAYVTEDMLVDRLLVREAASMTAQYVQHGDAGPPSYDLIRAYRSIDALPPEVRRSMQAGVQRAEVFTRTGQHYHVRTLDLGAGPQQRRYLVADVAPLLVVSALIGDIGALLLAVALGLTGLACLLAYLLARRLVLPLQELAQQVRSHQLDQAQAFTARLRPDEIGYLARKLGDTSATLHAALAREHAFTRDVSHELRTPLTILHNTFGQASGRALDRMETAQAQAGLAEIGNTIDVLFALARAEQIASAAFDLRGVIEDCLLRLVEQGLLDSARLQLDLPDRLAVHGHPHLATILINNCLGNAVFHGGPAALLGLSFADGVLSVANTVDTDREGGMQGFLHGQNLLQRLAAAMDWELGVHQGAQAYRVDITVLRAA